MSEEPRKGSTSDALVRPRLHKRTVVAMPNMKVNRVDSKEAYGDGYRDDRKFVPSIVDGQAVEQPKKSYKKWYLFGTALLLVAGAAAYYYINVL